MCNISLYGIFQVMDALDGNAWSTSSEGCGLLDTVKVRRHDVISKELIRY
jgi:hypothetical protein